MIGFYFYFFLLMDDFLKVGPPIAVQFLSVPLKQLYALSYTI